MALRITSLRRDRATTRAIRMSDTDDQNMLPQNMLPLTAMLVLCGLLATLLLLTTP